MDCALALENGRSCFLTVSKNTNLHILAFYYIDDEIECRWIHRDTEGRVIKVTDLSAFDKSFLNIKLESSNEKLKFNFGLPLTERELFFTKMPPMGDQDYGVVFDGALGISHLREVFLDVENSSVYCSCIDFKTKKTFVENETVDLGLFKWTL